MSERSENDVDLMAFHPLGEIVKDDLGAEAHRLLRGKGDVGSHKAVGRVQDGIFL